MPKSNNPKTREEQLPKLSGTGRREPPGSVAARSWPRKKHAVLFVLGFLFPVSCLPSLEVVRTRVTRHGAWSLRSAGNVSLSLDAGDPG